MQESLATLNKYRMRWRNITEGRVETVDAVNWGGHSFKLKVIWNPTTTQLDRLFDSSKDNFVRGLVSGADVVVWDAYQTEHVMAAQALGLARRAQRQDCFFIHRYGASDNRIGPNRSVEELATIPTLARLVATGHYRLGGPDHALVESVLRESVGLHGWWITHSGEHIDVDHDNDQHHADVAKASFDIADYDGSSEVYDDDDQGDVEHEPDYDSAEEAIKTALDFGWVRGSAYGDKMTIEWARLSKEAQKAVLTWIKGYGSAYATITIGNVGKYENFDNPRDAASYVRSA